MPRSVSLLVLCIWTKTRDTFSHNNSWRKYMNKKLLAVAIGAALAAAPMFANAAATLYGAAHLSIDSLDNGNTITATSGDSKLTTLSNNASYIGFKAEDDLGGGMKAFVDAQLQLTLDIASTNFSNRNTTAGLTGGFGTVRLGNYDDVLKQVGRSVDMFMSEQLGESRSLTAPGGWDARLANSVTYQTPSLGGVTATLNYGMANTSGNVGSATTSCATAAAVPANTTGLTCSAAAVAAGVQYSGGPLYVGVAWKTVDLIAATETTAIRVAAAVTMGPVKVGALYQQVEGATPTSDRDTYGVGASFKVGNGLIKGQYYVAGDTTLAATDAGATLIAVGYDHNLSKTTTLYAVYASVENDPAGAFQVISAAGHGTNPDSGSFAATAAGNKGSGVSLGMVMKF